ncbi:DUF6817 domain-containing protein [Streptomyces sp. NPDC087300]|uniref:DUF6817 domain-containing protein n=1 Tax=Streptomyces sp. NPDC087300 TaxID=3365780 RepID=UPI0037F48A1C
MDMAAEPDRAAHRFLRDLGAATVEHPGGTLLDHLERVRQRLADWDARPALRLAGLCHALYGTDGFAPVLLPLDRRERATAVIGGEAESLVYLYASCDRAVGHPALTGRTGDGTPVRRDRSPLFRDRFTGRAFAPTRRQQADFAELTVANELDIAGVDGEFLARCGPGLAELFAGLRPLLTPGARRACAILPGWTY